MVHPTPRARRIKRVADGNAIDRVIRALPSRLYSDKMKQVGSYIIGEFAMSKLTLFLAPLIWLVATGCSEKKNPSTVSELEQGLQSAERSDWKGARLHFERAVEEDPSNGLAWANHGTALLNLGEPEKAVQSYLRAKELTPKDPYIYCSLCSAKSRLGRYEEAIRYADEALAADPNYAPAMANKGRALKHLGRSKEAAALFEKAFRLMPELRQHFVATQADDTVEGGVGR